MNFIESSFWVGFFGDIGLQTIVKNSKDDNLWGLRTYFDQHGSLESMFIASGMMVGFSFIYEKFIDPDLNLFKISIYGIILDILFRNLHDKIMPSLKDYYKKVNPLFTMFWGYVPFILAIQLKK